MSFLDFGPKSRPVDAIFLHANGFNALTYRRILAPLADRYRLLCFDQRGHGASGLETTITGRRDWLDLRDDLLAALDVMDLGGVVLSGHSMGGTVSLLAAAQTPMRCRRLVLFDPAFPPRDRRPLGEDSPLIQAAARRRSTFPSRESASRSYRGRGAFRTWPDEILADYVSAGFRDLPSGGVTLTCTPAWEASGFAAQGHDPWTALARSEHPIDIFRAEIDSTLRLGDAAEINSDRIQITTTPGTTHFLPMERPDLVRSALCRAIEAATPSIATGGAPV
jgi:pimeloyl-ACP methyl ester carboxylesterase